MVTVQNRNNCITHAQDKNYITSLFKGYGVIFTECTYIFLRFYVHFVYLYTFSIFTYKQNVYIILYRSREILGYTPKKPKNVRTNVRKNVRTNVRKNVRTKFT